MTPSTFTLCTWIWWGERHRAKETANACFSSCVCCFIYMCLLYTYESMWYTTIQSCVPVCIVCMFSFVDAVARTHWISTPRNGNRMRGAGCSGNGDALAVVNSSLKTTNNQKAIKKMITRSHSVQSREFWLCAMLPENCWSLISDRRNSTNSTFRPTICAIYTDHDH